MFVLEDRACTALKFYDQCACTTTFKSKTSQFTHTLYACISFDPHNEHTLVLLTASKDKSLYLKHSVFCRKWICKYNLSNKMYKQPINAL